MSHFRHLTIDFSCLLVLMKGKRFLNKKSIHCVVGFACFIGGICCLNGGGAFACFYLFIFDNERGRMCRQANRSGSSKRSHYRLPVSFFPDFEILSHEGGGGGGGSSGRSTKRPTAFSHSMKIPFPIPFIFWGFWLFPFHLISMISSFANHFIRFQFLFYLNFILFKFYLIFI
jgi:hypothetical protein